MGVALKQLHVRHREILRLHLMGATANDIANELGVTPELVNYTVGSDMGKLAIEHMQTQLDVSAMDVQAELYENAKHSELFLGSIVKGEVEGITNTLRARVCMDQLDRAGFGKVTKNVNLDFHGSITAEEVERIKEEARRLRGIVVSAEEVDNQEGDAPTPQESLDPESHSGSCLSPTPPTPSNTKPTTSEEAPGQHE